MDNHVNQNRIILYIFICIIMGVTTALSIDFAAKIMVGAGFIFLVSSNPLNALACFLLLSPYFGTIYLSEPLLNIQLLKPVQIIVFIVILVSMLNYSKSEKLDSYSLYVLCAIVILFTVTIYRSLEYLHLFNTYYFSEDPLSTKRYLFSHLIKPLFVFVPFVVIMKFVNTRRKLAYIYNIIYITTILLSIHILYTYAFVLKFDFDIVKVSEYYSSFYGFHRNQLATFYVIGFPIALGKYFSNKKIHSILFTFLILCAIGFLFSRTAYLTTVLSILIYIIISRKFKIIHAIMIIFIILSFIISGAVMKRATYGLESKNRAEISAGRIDDIWVPLIREYMSNPKKLFVGNGRYSIISSDAASKGSILQEIQHPHNMYLEMIIDAGLIGFTIFIIIFYGIIKYAFNTIKDLKDMPLKEYLYSFIVSTICFLISGLTGRSLFPKADNIFIWVVLSCMIVTCVHWERFAAERI